MSSVICTDWWDTCVFSTIGFRFRVNSEASWWIFVTVGKKDGGGKEKEKQRKEENTKRGGEEKCHTLFLSLRIMFKLASLQAEHS